MPESGFGLYVHWPFCQAKCPYCDFNSHVSAHVDQTRWRAALVSEIHRYGETVPDRVLQTVFFGGGTPSLMDPGTVAAIIEAARATWPGANDMEITLEANPTSVEAGRFRGYRDAGVNRVSMGIQALNDPDLRALGRLHTVAEARAAFDIARATFDRVSFDLIYARQGQSAGNWRAELRAALDMAADHLSLYQLTIEDGTAFGDRFARGGLAGLPDEDLSADLYEITQEICDDAGLPAYEVSNHARPGAESRHNLIYWQGGDYIGIGPGAHGRITFGDQRVATETLRQPGAWLGAVEQGDPAERTEPIGPADRGAEYLMMGLRLSDGISLDRFENLSRGRLDHGALTDMVFDGLLQRDGDRLSTTRRGRMVLNAVLKRLLTA